MPLTKCGACEFWRKVDGEPSVRGFRYCIRRERQVVVAPKSIVGDTRHHRQNGYLVSVYAIMHRSDRCGCGEPKST